MKFKITIQTILGSVVKSKENPAKSRKVAINFQFEDQALLTKLFCRKSQAQWGKNGVDYQKEMENGLCMCFKQEIE